MILITGIVGGGGGATITTEEEAEGEGLDENAVEVAEGDADDDDIVCDWFEGPAPLTIGILGLMISSSSS